MSHRSRQPQRSYRRHVRTALAAAIALLATMLVQCPVANASTTSSQTTPARVADDRPNVVVVMVDDMSENLYKYMSEVTLMKQQGVTFPNYFNSTPWCCPSRAAFQTGKYPHNNHVLSNGGSLGGFERFLEYDIDSSVGVLMQAAGYRTGLLGKYLNGYKITGGKTYPADYIPPGWTSWYSGGAYSGFNYTMLVDTDTTDAVPPTRESHGSAASDYYTDVLSDRVQQFVTTAGDEPYFLVVTPFAPHGGLGGDPEGNKIRFPAAPRDRAKSKSRPKSWGAPESPNGDCGPVSCKSVPWPDTTNPSNFNRVVTNPLSWMAQKPMSKKDVTKAKKLHVQRIQAVQGVNDLLRDLRLTLEATGQSDHTYVMFTSDNGYHLGEHALFSGKTTAYDHDIRTPLVVRPPGGVAPPLASPAMLQNTDIVPTVLSIAGATIPADIDGLSAVPLFTQPDLPWRDATLLELTNDGSSGETRYFNPDIQGREGEHVAPTYNAIRAADFLYIDYSTIDGTPPLVGQAEFYDLTTDVGETYNRFATLTTEQRATLNDRLLALTSCAGAGCATLLGLPPEE